MKAIRKYYDLFYKSLENKTLGNLKSVVSRFIVSRSSVKSKITSLTKYDPELSCVILVGFPRSPIPYNNFFPGKQIIKADNGIMLFIAACKVNLANSHFYHYESDGKSLLGFFIKALLCLTKYKECNHTNVCKGLIRHPKKRSAFTYLVNAKNLDDLSIASVNAQPLQRVPDLLKMYKMLNASLGMRSNYCDVKKYLGIKLKKRVLVVLSKKQNFAIKAKVLKLALEENPEAEVYFIVNKNKNLHTPGKCTFKVCNERDLSVYYEVPQLYIDDLVKECDILYTWNSSEAIDGIFYGKKVVVFGSPFYAGYGLTDDRQKIFRARNLSLEEFFAALFLQSIYPYETEDQASAFASMILELSAYKEGTECKKACSADESRDILRNKYSLLSILDLQKNKALPNMLYFGSNAGTSYNRAVAAAFLGVAPKARVAKLSAILSSYINLGDLSYILDRLSTMAKFQGLKDINKIQEAKNIVLTKQKNYNGINARIKMLWQLSSLTEPQKSVQIKSNNDVQIQLSLALALVEGGKYAKAEELLYEIMLGGYFRPGLFKILGDIAYEKMHFNDAVLLYEAANILGDKSNYFAKYARALNILGRPYELIYAMAQEIANSRPSSGVGVLLLRKAFFEEYCGRLNYQQITKNLIDRPLRLVQKTDQESLNDVLAYLTIEEHEKAKEIIDSGAIDSLRNSSQYGSILILYLTFAEDASKAKAMAEQYLMMFPSSNLLTRACYLAIKSNDYDWGEKMVNTAKVYGLQHELTSMLSRKTLIAKGQIKESYLTFRMQPFSEELKVFFSEEKYIQSANQVARSENRKNSILILACFGPGDEIRFASFYEQMAALFGGLDVTFTVEPRLIGFYERSYPKLNFMPVARQRELGNKTNLANYNELPSIKLVTVLDNAGWKSVQKSDYVTLTTDLLGDVIEDKSSFAGRAYFEVDKAKKKNWMKRVEAISSKPRIGISWRSSLATYTRNEHYLFVDELKPLFDHFGDKVDFFNFQYDLSNFNELEWIEQNTKAKVINFSDLDQYNDLENVAALMKCMDLMIAPATTVVELSGAIGCKTLMASNSSELHWRKVDDITKMDCWHNSIIHVEGDKTGDKESLVRNLIEKIESLIW